MHLIALGLKNRLNIPWLADFRDPWTGIDFYHKLRLTARADGPTPGHEPHGGHNVAPRD